MSNLTTVLEPYSHGLGYVQPYPFGIPEDLPHNAFTAAAASSLIAFTGQGRVMGISVSSTLGAGQFVQVFNASTLPADGAVPLISVPIAATASIGLAFTPGGRWFTIGCVVCNSTTQATKTIGAANCLIDVQYIPQVI
jgi:hypothetical protein